MLTLSKLLHIGDISLTLAAAAGMTAWLLAARAWRMAFWWTLLFALGIGLVGASKVAFMAWGISLPALDFRALSGHATGVTAVFPTLFYLLLSKRSARARGAGVCAGLLLGALMAVLLVAEREHSSAEAIAGWVMGATVSLGGIWMAGEPPPQRPPYALLCSAVVFMTAVSLMRNVPVGYLMFRTAKLISWHAAPFPWHVGS
jgi:hypothetical protein